MLLTEKFGFLMHLTWITVLIRVALATLCGGSVGIERAYRGRPAGFFGNDAAATARGTMNANHMGTMSRIGS